MAKRKRTGKRKAKKTYVKGGKRKKSMYANLKEGAFTKFCKSIGYTNVQACARHVLANKKKYSTARVKQASFARTQKKIARKK